MTKLGRVDVLDSAEKATAEAADAVADDCESVIDVVLTDSISADPAAAGPWETCFVVQHVMDRRRGNKT